MSTDNNTSTPNTDKPQVEIKSQTIPELVQENCPNSRFSSILKEASRDARRLFKLDDKKLGRFVRAYDADLGRWESERDKSRQVKFGQKLDKDGYIPLKDVTKAMGMFFTISCKLAKLITVLNDAPNWGLDVNLSELYLTEDLQEWLSKK